MTTPKDGSQVKMTEVVIQADLDMANDYLSSAFRCTATLAERFARHRSQTEAAIVAWLRSDEDLPETSWRNQFLADAIARGEHIAAIAKAEGRS